MWSQSSFHISLKNQIIIYNGHFSSFLKYTSSQLSSKKQKQGQPNRNKSALLNLRQTNISIIFVRAVSHPFFHVCMFSCFTLHYFAYNSSTMNSSHSFASIIKIAQYCTRELGGNWPNATCQNSIMISHHLIFITNLPHAFFS